MRYLLLSLLLAGCAGDWQSVRITQGAAGCRHVQQLTCQTNKSNIEARCEKWHKVNALKVGANTVVPFSASTADYYACP